MRVREREQESVQVQAPVLEPVPVQVLGQAPERARAQVLAQE